MPREHGAWGILLIPFATAVGVAGIWNLPVALLLVSILCFYVARTSWLKQNYRWTVALLAGSAAFAVPLLIIWKLWWLAAFGVVAVPLAFRKTERGVVMQLIAFNAGWSKTEARELFEQAIAFEPGYYHFYREYAQYLQPQWYGQLGDIPAFAEEASKPLPEPASSILYFQIVSSLACNCRPVVDDLPRINYPKARQGYKSL